MYEVWTSDNIIFQIVDHNEAWGHIPAELQLQHIIPAELQLQYVISDMICSHKFKWLYIE